MEKSNFNILTRIKKWGDINSPVFTSRLSLLICLVLASNGIYLGIIENSLAVQINGFIAAIDVLNSLLFLTAVNQSLKDPDNIFNYGYGKYESMSILAAAGLLLIVSVYALYEAWLNYGNSQPIEGNQVILVSFSAFCLFIYITMYKLQRKTAKKYKMPILDYDAAIWKIDSFIEMSVLVNLTLGTILRYYKHNYIATIIDSTTAIALLAFALKIPIEGSRNAINQLLDRTVPENIRMDIIRIVAENFNNMCLFKEIHTRQSGKDIFIEIDVVMPYDFTIEQIFDLEIDIKKSLVHLYPTCVPRVYSVPCPRDCEHNGKSSCPVKQHLGIS